MKYETVYFVPKLDDPESPRVRALMQDFKKQLDLQGVTGQLDKVNDKTLIVSVGGDGTAIEAMKIGAQGGADVMCFNLGRIGFLADFEPNRVYEYIRAIDGEHTQVEERMLLVANNYAGDTEVAVNDIVISRLYADEMLVYDLFVDGAYAGSHRANGVIVSTPTGSTAYALSAGGAILHPEVECFQIVPIAPTTLNSRPIIVAAKAEIKIKVDLKSLRGESKKVVVRADGQVTAVGNDEKDEQATAHNVVIKAFPNKARVLHQSHWNYFDVLTQKLYWNK